MTPPNRPIDRTALAVRRQLHGMGCQDYEIGVRDRKTGKMLLRQWNREETLTAIPWLKRQNAKGADIYIRPAGERNQGLVLLDDLTQGQLQTMKTRGVAPATVVETSPFNFQAWVRLSHEPLEPRTATQAAKLLAQEFEGDPNSADWRHFGRLAGFTNRKPEHTDPNGRNPYVLAHEAPGKIAERGPTILQWINERLRENDLRQEKNNRLEASRSAQERVYGRDPLAEYRSQLKRLLARYGESPDYSRLDWMICRDMAMKGYNAADLTKALQEASPELPQRKLGHEEDYIERTVSKVLEDPEVIEQRQQLAQRRQPSRGPSLGL